jgi:AraC-like DNA-binding protein
MWDGRFEFGDGWAAYRGETDQNSPHFHAAIQIAIGIENEIAMRSDSGFTRGRVIAVPPMLRHEFAEAKGEVVALYVEADAPLGRALRYHCGPEMRVLPLALLEGEPEEMIARLGMSLGTVVTGPSDSRLLAALAFLRAAPGGPGAVRETALVAGLSASRLRELARAELGLSLSQWLLWQKLARASRALASGAPLVDAAFAGGFADQAHFARTMRRMFGVTPRIAAGTLAQGFAAQ